MTVIKFPKPSKFTKEDINAKFLSDDIDDCIFKSLSNVDPKLICAVLANRLGECLNAVPEESKEGVLEICISTILKKCSN